MYQGWVKLHRQSLNHPLFQKPLIWHFWQYLFLKANHAPVRIIWNGQEITVERGCLIFGREKAARETGLSERNIRTALQTLINLEMVQKSTTKSTNKYTYLSIVNYEKFQGATENSDQQHDHEVTSRRPASGQQVTTYKKEKNDNNYKPEKKDILRNIFTEQKKDYGKGAF